MYAANLQMKACPESSDPVAFLALPVNERDNNENGRQKYTGNYKIYK
jgi:hypothetical protein